jgi:hypothetical protein
MLKVFVFLNKREDIETQAFIVHYEEAHVPLICSLAPTHVVYKRNSLVRGDEINREDESIDFDVVTELVFPDRATYFAWSTAVGTGVAGDKLSLDESTLLNRQ